MSKVTKNKYYSVMMLLSFVLICAVSLGGCTRADNETGKPVVYTSVYPLYDFTVKIAGDCVDVRSLIQGGAEPHDWEPSPSDIIALEKADVLIINGLGMEHWIDKVSDTLDNKELLIVETAVSLGHIETSHEHEHEDSLYDPHVWLNPQNAKIQMKHIKDALVSVDEKNKDVYENNYLKYEKMFDELDEQYKQTLSNTARNFIIVSHSAFSYMCEAYGITELSVGGVFDDAEPDPATMAETVNIIRKEGLEYIFYTDANNTKVVDTLAKEAGIKSLYLCPLENISRDDQESNADYFSIMLRNLENLKKSLN